MEELILKEEKVENVFICAFSRLQLVLFAMHFWNLFQM